MSNQDKYTELSCNCSKNERMFLDELREKGKYNPGGDAIEIGKNTIIYNKDFQWANPKELVNDTETKTD